MEEVWGGGKVWEEGGGGCRERRVEDKGTKRGWNKMGEERVLKRRRWAGDG